MPPLGFPRRSLFWIMLFFGLLFALPVLPLVATFTFVIEPPLQRYYLLAYEESAKTAGQPGATTPIVWLYKTAPGRHRVLLTERDAQGVFAACRFDQEVRLNAILAGLDFIH